VVTGCILALVRCEELANGRSILGNGALILGIVEGATLLGWRLTQLPKSQALEFLLVSPLRPRRLFLAEALVGMSRLALATLSGLPIFAALAGAGYLDPLDLVPLLVMPWTWGVFAGLTLTVWAYEPLSVRRWGERVVLGLILLYLVVGVLAGEHLKEWLSVLPGEAERWIFNGFLAFHRFNPFALMQAWMAEEAVGIWKPLAWLQLGAILALGILLWRCARRLQGHFHELHYLPATDPMAARRASVGDRPLTWWSVRRVMRYSGRINFWLVGGFGILYAAYTVAGDRWPAWLGRAVFETCDRFGGLAGLTAALVVLAAVPAAFQYGLWDSNAQDRCRRLELLLLTHLQPEDYWHAAASAAWKRGRGYFGVAVLLWLAAILSGQAEVLQIWAAGAAGVLLWGLYFALGFRAFSRGLQANGLGMVLTLGVPLLAFGLSQANWLILAQLLPPASVHGAAVRLPSPSWALGPVLAGGMALSMSRHSLWRCDRELRRWYEQHHGSKVMS
jgi:hypothetical protein